MGFIPTPVATAYLNKYWGLPVLGSLQLAVQKLSSYWGDVHYVAVSGGWADLYANGYNSKLVLCWLYADTFSLHKHLVRRDLFFHASRLLRKMSTVSKYTGFLGFSGVSESLSKDAFDYHWHDSLALFIFLGFKRWCSRLVTAQFPWQHFFLHDCRFLRRVRPGLMDNKTCSVMFSQM